MGQGFGNGVFMGLAFKHGVFMGFILGEGSLRIPWHSPQAPLPTPPLPRHSSAGQSALWDPGWPRPPAG